MKTQDYAGFSLVELSIVLVILGLLTGGILSGQSLIRAAEQRNFVTQITNYSATVATFRDKYMAIPGDMRNASAFWNAADGSTGLTNACLNSTAAGTCNGNGDGGLNTQTYSHENFRFWQHMSLAGLIEGTYTGVTGPLEVTDVVAGTNVPSTKIGSTSVIFPLSLTSVSASNTYYFPGSYGTVAYRVGADTNGGNFNGDSNTFTNEMAWNIDSKMDDGKPGTGKVTTYLNSRRAECASSDNPSTAEYQLTITIIACLLIIPSGI